jgi:hypothetical protein
VVTLFNAVLQQQKTLKTVDDVKSNKEKQVKGVIVFIHLASLSPFPSSPCFFSSHPATS